MAWLCIEFVLQRLLITIYIVRLRLSIFRIVFSNFYVCNKYLPYRYSFKVKREEKMGFDDGFETSNYYCNIDPRIGSIGKYTGILVICRL